MNVCRSCIVQSDSLAPAANRLPKFALLGSFGVEVSIGSSRSLNAVQIVVLLAALGLSPPFAQAVAANPTSPRPAYVDGRVSRVDNDGRESYIVVATSQDAARAEVQSEQPTGELPSPTDASAVGEKPTLADSGLKPSTVSEPNDEQATTSRGNLPAPTEPTPSPLLPTPSQESELAPPPYLGARVMKNGLRSVTVVRVRDNSPAARAKLKAGDAITAIDGRPVESFQQLMLGVRRKAAGEIVQLTILRGTRQQQLDVKLAEIPQVQP